MRIKNEKTLFVAIAIIVILVIMIEGWQYYKTEEVIMIDVTGKERISSRESSKYLIYTESEVFECTDTMYYLKYNSSDIYGKLIAGQSYQCKVAGWRIHFFSMYRNIISIEKK